MPIWLRKFYYKKIEEVINKKHTPEKKPPSRKKTVGPAIN